MFEVDVKKHDGMEKGRRGPARVWGSDLIYNYTPSNVLL